MKLVVFKNIDPDNEKRMTIRKSEPAVTLDVRTTDTTSFAYSEDGLGLDLCLPKLSSEPVVLQPFDNAILHYWWDDSDGRDLDTSTGVVEPNRTPAAVGYGGSSYFKAATDGPYLTWGGDNTGSGRESVKIDFKQLVIDYPDQTVFEINARCWWWSMGLNGNVTVQLETFLGGELVADGYGFNNVGGLPVQNISIAHNVMLQKSSVIPGVLVAKVLLNPVDMSGQLIKVNGDAFVPLTSDQIWDDKGDTRIRVKSSINDFITIVVGGNTLSGYVGLNGYFTTGPISRSNVTGTPLTINAVGGAKGPQTLTHILKQRQLITLTKYDPFQQKILFSGGLDGDAIRLYNPTKQIAASGVFNGGVVELVIPDGFFNHADPFTVEHDGRYSEVEGDTYTNPIKTVFADRYVDYTPGDEFVLTTTQTTNLVDFATSPHIAIDDPDALFASWDKLSKLRYYVTGENITGLSAVPSNYGGTSNEMEVHRGLDNIGAGTGSWWAGSFRANLSAVGTKTLRVLIVKGNGQWPTNTRVKVSPRNFDLISYGRFAPDINASQFTTQQHPVLPTTVTKLVDSFIGNIANVSEWDVSRVTKFNRCFQPSFNKDISSWNVSAATDMTEMFFKSTALNTNLDAWDVSNVTTMKGMFKNTNVTNITLDISQWDTSKVTDMSEMFYSCYMGGIGFIVTGLNTAAVTNMAGMFKLNLSFNQDISGWNTANVINMGNMFEDAKVFNQNIGGWIVSKVTNMNRLFALTDYYTYDTKFNQPLGSWDVSSVTDMAYMFYKCNNFNQDISGWNTSNVTTMERMFDRASAFNVAIGNWNVSKVRSFSYMLQRTTAFNKDITGWDVSSGRDFSGLFSGKSDFNQNISTWNVSNAINMAGMFSEAAAFIQPIGNWNVSNVTDMSGMFISATSFNQDITGWDVSNVTKFDSMFEAATNFNQDISTWNVSSAFIMNKMFKNANTFNQNLSTWCTRDILVAPNEFAGAGLTTDKRPVWGTCPLNNYTFKGMRMVVTGEVSLKVYTYSALIIETTYDILNPYKTFENDVFTAATPSINYGLNIVRIRSADGGPIKGLLLEGNVQEITKWADNGHVSHTSTTGVYKTALGKLPAKLTKVPLNFPSQVTDATNLFKGCTLFNGDVSGWDVSNVTNMMGMFQECSAFNQPLNTWNVSNVTNMGYMLYGTTIFDQPLNTWDVSKVTDMSYMFFNSRAFNQNISTWNVLNVTTMSNTFALAMKFNQPLNTWNVSNVKYMQTMFYYATAFNQPLNLWDTSKVVVMVGMFQNATAFNEDISSWNVSGVTNFYNMFESATTFNQPLNTWDMSNVTDMSYMFQNATAFNGDISGWNTSKVSVMYASFNGAAAFNQDISGWNVNKVNSMSYMFQNATAFNQNLSQWCVPNIYSAPYNFGYNAPLMTTEKLPVWGTCPRGENVVVI